MLRLTRAEAILLSVSALLVSWLWIAEAIGHARIAWSTFTLTFVLFGGIAGFGLLMRVRNVAPRWQATLVMVGLYLTFGSLMSLSTMTAFPLQRPLIDDFLFRIDAMIGFDWQKAVHWQAQYPTLSWVLAQLYKSSIIQIMLLFVLLGLTRPESQLGRLALTGMYASLLTVGFWVVFPSFGPSAYIVIEAETRDAASLVVTSEYGAYLQNLARNGLPTIQAHEVLGTVAFPSYHMFMAILTVWFARATLLFWPAVAVNVPVVWATLTHGGHHLFDLVGGVLVFAAALALAGRSLRAPAPGNKQQTRPVAA